MCYLVGTREVGCTQAPVDTVRIVQVAAGTLPHVVAGTLPVALEDTYYSVEALSDIVD